MGRPVLPDVYAEIRDGGLGLAPGRLEGIHVKVGVASSGPVGQLIFLSSQREALQKYGSGPLVDAMIDSFSSGAQVIYGLRANASIQGSIGGAVGVMVECALPGALGVARIRYSLDGGVSWPQEVLVPANGEVAIPSRGMTLTFKAAAGETDPSLVGGDLWRFTVDTCKGTVVPGAFEVTGTAELEVTGSKTAVTSIKSGTGDMTPGGSPQIESDVVVQIVQSGGLNAATYRYSLDDGDTWSGNITVPMTTETTGKAAISGTGIELDFLVGASGADEADKKSFEVGDTWQFHTEAPKMSNGDLIDALDVLYETSVEYEFVHVVGPSGRPVWAACGAMAETMFANHRYTFFLCEARGRNDKETVDEWVGSLIEESAKFASWRVGVVAARLELVDMNTGYQVDRNAAGIVAGLIAKNPVQRSIGFVMYNPVTLGLELNPYPQFTAAHVQALDAARYITMRRYVGLRGIYVTNGRTMAEVTSDFRYIELVRAMNRACRLVRTALLGYVHGEADAPGLKYLLARAKQPLLQMQQDREIMDSDVMIPAGQDIISTSEVEVSVGIVPIPIMRWIRLSIGFENPAIRALLESNR